MKSLFTILILFTSCSILSQESFSEQDAKDIVETFFEGFHKGDTLLMKSVLMENAPLQTAATNNEGNAVLTSDTIDNLLIAIANRPDDQKWEEKLLDFKIKIDGNLAHVWTPYEFWFNNNFSHCGANAFTIAKTDTGWKIIHLIDSRRRADCN